jgi:hypothetical protein
MPFSKIDKDSLHRERVNAYNKRLGSSPQEDKDLFVSERVSTTITEPKLFLENYRLNEIVSAVPYYDTIYSVLCPECMRRESVKNLKILIDRGTVIPVLIAPYRSYGDELLETLYGHDHINLYEFSLYRFLSIMGMTGSGICRHCIGVWQKSAAGIIGQDSELRPYKRNVQQLLSNLTPYIKPDSGLLDSFKDALRAKDVSQIE